MDDLCKYIHERARAANLSLDKYDPDFITGVIMQWLGDHHLILTSSGLEEGG